MSLFNKSAKSAIFELQKSRIQRSGDSGGGISD